MGAPLTRMAHPSYTGFMTDDRSSERLDPVVAVYLKDVDRTLLRENLRLSHEDRLRQLQSFVRTVAALREARHKAQR